MYRHTFNNKNNHKYNARKVEINGITFDSAVEGRYYTNLLTLGVSFNPDDTNYCAMQVNMELQPKFRINGKAIRAINYRPDFVFYEQGTVTKVVDVKGMLTPEFKLKAKLFTAKYGVPVTIVKYTKRDGFTEKYFYEK